MTDQPSRRRWLALFVILNLLVWIAVAAALGVIASDLVDLGGEALLRTWHATAQVAWQEVAARLPTSQATNTPLAVGAANTAIDLRPADGDATAAPGATVQAEIVTPGTPVAEPQPAHTPQPPSPQGTLAPVETAVAAPLILSDPGLSNLMRLDSEMERSAAGRPVQIRYQEAALNQEIQTLLRNNPNLPYGDIAVDLKRDLVFVAGDVEVLGFRTGIEMTGRVVAIDCQPELEIQAIEIAGILTPGFVKDKIAAILLEVTTWYPADYPLCLEQIVIEEDRATVYGRCR